MYHVISQTQQFTQQSDSADEWLSEDVDDFINDIIPLDEIIDRLCNTSNTPEEEFVLNEDQSTALEKKNINSPKVKEFVSNKDQSNGNGKVLMDVASVKAINQIISEEMASYKENRIIQQSHVDLTLEWSKTWEKAMKQETKKRKKPLTVKEKKKIQCSKRIKKKRANFYRKYHNICGSSGLISLHVDDPELNGDPNMDNYVNDFNVNQYM